MFPPRYAGMEGVPRRGQRYCQRFPRATRGWKDGWNVIWSRYFVSPALRGDGRLIHLVVRHRRRFPPRYAGMEGTIVARIRRS